MSKRQPHFVIYPDAGGEYRWSLRAANGKIIADGGESYTTLNDCREAVTRVQEYAADAETRESDTPPIERVAVAAKAPAETFGVTRSATHEQSTCPRCGLTSLVSGEGLCPNNNCPRHYHSYAGWLAAGHQPIPEEEAKLAASSDATGTP
jgi:Uncharacterized conserved protein